MKVLIADDELLARKRLRRLLEAMPDVEILGEVADGASVLAAIRASPVDLVLLDIQMPGLTGVEAMQLWPEAGPAIVFTTAHAEHAVAAFEGGAVDYVLKPIEAGRLRKALERVFAERAIARPRPPAAEGPARLPLATRNGVVLLDPALVLCAFIDGASVKVETDRGAYFTDQALSELEARLGPGFRRVHRKALVNLARVQRFEDNDMGGYVAHLEGGRRVEVSRAVARDLRREWGV